MDRELDACGRCGFGQRVCGTANYLRARVPRSTGLRNPATLSTTARLPGRAASGSSPRYRRGAWAAGCAHSRLASPGDCSGSCAGTSAAATTGCPAATTGRLCAVSAPTASGRGQTGSAGYLLCLDSRLLGLERHLGMGQRPMGCAAEAERRLGRRALVAARPRLCLDRRQLAVAGGSSSSVADATRLASPGGQNRGLRPHGYLRCIATRCQPSSSRSSACISCRCRKGRGRCGRLSAPRGRAWPFRRRRRLR
jgi:hypothetical protein